MSIKLANTRVGGTKDFRTSTPQGWVENAAAVLERKIRYMCNHMTQPSHSRMCFPKEFLPQVHQGKAMSCSDNHSRVHRVGTSMWSSLEQGLGLHSGHSPQRTQYQQQLEATTHTHTLTTTTTTTTRWTLKPKDESKK